MKKLFNLITITLLIILSCSCAFAQSRVAILPFKINASSDMSYLKDGIFDMLSSRLSWEEKVIIIDKSEVEKQVPHLSNLNESDIKRISTALKADYVILGSVTLFGGSVSIDAKVLDILKAKQTLTFFEQCKNIDEIIPKINKISEEVNEKIFGKAISPKSQDIKLSQPLVQEPSIHDHPEKSFQGQTVPVVPSLPLSQTFTPATQTSTFWKSRNFDFEIKGMALGDVDNDRKNETVLITNQDIHVYRIENSQLYKIKEINGKKSVKYLTVDVADINKNSKAEIFITSLNTLSNTLDSFVLEWNGKNFEMILKDQGWYFRIINHPEKGQLLMGQKKGINDVFIGGVSELLWNGREYISQNQLKLPKGINIFSFALGNLFNKNEEMMVCLDSNDHLRLYNNKNEEDWKSGEYYGGGENYIDIFPGTESQERYYIPQRIIVSKLQEIIVVKNQATTGRLLSQFRQYNNGNFESLSWTGAGLSSKWQSEKLSGYISDYSLGDFDNDGKIELGLALLSKRGFLMQKPQSVIITYKK
ncbi:MAG: hypothetical protein HQK79_07665 [Desulfobacterales bacterium]|nr:hypothetical protein [Desulfobacterales bacterium]